MSKGPDLPRSFVGLALAVHALAVLSATWRYVAAPGGYPYGDDMSSHVAEVAMVARYLRHLDFDFWFPHENLGYPMFLAYQPLPAFLGGLLTAVADFMRIASPPLIVQRVGFPLLAALGRARGYKARYARYASSAVTLESKP